MKRAVILSGGTGSRLKPATANINKHLLPVYSSNGAVPMIYYPIATLVNSGITDILIVSSREHCGRIMEHLSDGKEFHADFTYKIQDTAHAPMGIASALKLARNFTNDEKFAVILGDNFFEDSFQEEFAQFSRSNDSASIFLKEVHDPQRFGVYADGQIEEKPIVPKSNWAVSGLYLYTPNVYDIANTLVVSARGELEVSDINSYYCQRSMHVNYIKGFWSDCGTVESMLKTQNWLNQCE